LTSNRLRKHGRGEDKTNDIKEEDYGLSRNRKKNLKKGKGRSRRRKKLTGRTIKSLHSAVSQNEGRGVAGLPSSPKEREEGTQKRTRKRLF